MSLVNESTRVEAFAGRINRELPQLSASAIRKISASEGQVLDKIKGLMAFIALMIFALTTLCVNTTLTAMIAERSREFALQNPSAPAPEKLLCKLRLKHC